jgi:hypothetical protein
MKKKRRFRIYYEDGAGIKHYVTKKLFSYHYSSDIEWAEEFSPYSQVAKFVREQPETTAAVLHCEEII